MKCRSEFTATGTLRCFCFRTTNLSGYLINFKGQNGLLYKEAHVHRVFKGSNQLYILLFSILRRIEDSQFCSRMRQSVAGHSDSDVSK
jgi:hypothetical protein